MSKKDLRRLLRIARMQGFTICLGGSGHLRVSSPEGRTITVPSTPGRGRSHANSRAALRRIGVRL